MNDCVKRERFAIGKDIFLLTFDIAKPNLLDSWQTKPGTCRDIAAHRSCVLVCGQALGYGAVKLNSSPIEQQASRAKHAHGSEIVRDKQNGATTSSRVAHLAQTLSLEVGISYRQHLVHYQNL